MAFLHHRKLYFANADYEEFTNFPVLIKIDDSAGDYPDLDAYNNISFHDSDGTKLSWGCKEFNAGGVSYYIVKCINIAKSDTNYIDVYYGGDTSTESKSGVCDANTVLLTDMVDYGDTSHVEDWTGVNTLTKVGAATPAEASGYIGLCQDFNGTSDYITIASNAAIDISGDYTLELYLRLDDLTGDQYIYNAGYNNNSSILWYQSGTLMKVLERTAAGANNFYQSEPFNLSAEQWFTFSFKRATNVLSYFLNSTKGTDDNVAGVNTATNDHHIGWARPRDNASTYTGGLIGLVRLSDTARSDNWLKAQDKILRQQDYVTFGSQVDQIRAYHTKPTVVRIMGQ